MKRTIIALFALCFFLCCTLAASAGVKDGKPAYILNREQISFIQVVVDTIPGPAKPAEVSPVKTATEKPVANVIKAVPKARKVSAPKPVQIKVKPVKVIKPRIIKPVLKVL